MHCSSWEISNRVTSAVCVCRLKGGISLRKTTGRNIKTIISLKTFAQVKKSGVQSDTFCVVMAASKPLTSFPDAILQTWANENHEKDPMVDTNGNIEIPTIDSNGNIKNQMSMPTKV